jgi:hypothetical protein
LSKTWSQKELLERLQLDTFWFLERKPADTELSLLHRTHRRHFIMKKPLSSDVLVTSGLEAHPKSRELTAAICKGNILMVVRICSLASKASLSY